MVQRKKGEQRSRRRAVIFDFDGTIADTVLAFARVFEELARLPQPLTPERIKHLQGLNPAQFMREFNLPKWKIPYLIFRGRRMLREHMDHIQLHNGITEVIEQLYADGIPLYIASSNSVETIQDYLKKRNLLHYFGGISGSASPFAKARKLLQLIDKNDIDIANSWYVGDETRDTIAAHAVGLHMVSVSWGFNNRAALEAKYPDAVVDTPEALLQILENAWKQ